VAFAVTITASTTQASPSAATAGPVFSQAAAFDVSAPLSEMVKGASASGKSLPAASGFDADRDLARAGLGGLAAASGSSAAAASPQSVAASQAASAIPATNANPKGEQYGRQHLRPRQPAGSSRDVGRNHYVEMVSLVFATVYRRRYEVLGQSTGTLVDFAVDAADPSGDPIVVYDQTADLDPRFTTRGGRPDVPFYNCVAVSATNDPGALPVRVSRAPRHEVPRSTGNVHHAMAFGPTINTASAFHASSAQMIN
jgi:hypothetical protein